MYNAHTGLFPLLETQKQRCGAESRRCCRTPVPQNKALAVDASTRGCRTGYLPPARHSTLLVRNGGRRGRHPGAPPRPHTCPLHTPQQAAVDRPSAPAKMPGRGAPSLSGGPPGCKPHRLSTTARPPAPPCTPRSQPAKANTKKRCARRRGAAHAQPVRPAGGRPDAHPASSCRRTPQAAAGAGSRTSFLPRAWSSAKTGKPRTILLQLPNSLRTQIFTKKMVPKKTLTD